MKRVIVELKIRSDSSKDAVLKSAAELPEFQIDEAYEPVSTKPSEEQSSALKEGEELVLVRGMVDEDKLEELRSAPNVIAVWGDARVEPFGTSTP